MFGIASKKDLEDLRYRMQIAMRDDRTTVALRHSGIDSRAFASCRRQVDIIAEVEALRAELDANDEDQAEINVDLLRLIELVRQLKEAAKANTVAIDMLLDLQGLKLQERPATEAGWMLVTKEEGE